MEIDMIVVSKIANPPKGDRTFVRYIIALQPVGGGALLELTFDNEAEADKYVVGNSVTVDVSI